MVSEEAVGYLIGSAEEPLWAASSSIVGWQRTCWPRVCVFVFVFV